MPSPVVLVYGHYGRGNLGDDLMQQALVKLFEPKGVSLRFVDRIELADLLAPTVGVVFGGGSILLDDPDVSPMALASLLERMVPVFYLGVGGETGPSPVHQQLIDVAAVVAFRELDMPDLAYTLASGLELEEAAEAQGLLFVPNVEVVPSHGDAHWKHVAWERFKDEAAQFLDRTIDRGTPVSFLLMCDGPQKEDAWPMHELLGRMKRRAPKPVSYLASSWLGDTVRLMRAHRAVFTQRYHGIVLAEAAGVPYVSVDHHDKLKLANPHRGGHVAYHGVTKDGMTDALETALASTMEPFRQSLQAHEALTEKIVSLLG